MDEPSEQAVNTGVTQSGPNSGAVSTSNTAGTAAKGAPPRDDDTTSKLIPVKSRESARYCWVCFASDEDDLEAAWVKPCKCRGTTKWVIILNLIK